MTKKIIEGGDLFFKDDVQIVTSELEKKLNLPTPPLFQRDELQIIYKGHAYVVARSLKDSIPDSQIKIYTKNYGLEEIKSGEGKVQSIKDLEESYFKENEEVIRKAQAATIGNCIVGIGTVARDPDEPADDSDSCNELKGLLTTQIGSQLVEKINQHYASKVKNDLPKYKGGSGVINTAKDGSEYNKHYDGTVGLLVLDRKLYFLETMQEYVKKFEKSFEPKFFESIYNMCKTAKPEEVAEQINKNTDKIHPKALPIVRNKIWHSNRSFKLYLDGTYFVPECKGTVDELEKNYALIIERKVKLDGVKKYL
jgi:hypothetical protein